MPAEQSRLASERTALAWQRSGFSLAAVAALVVVHAVHRAEPLGLAAAVVPAAGAAWVQLRGRRLYARRAAGDGRAAGESLRLLAALSLAVAVLAAVLVAGGS
jgi:uncharacterized membrane protein YidH (DUF202 family)